MAIAVARGNDIARDEAQVVSATAIVHRTRPIGAVAARIAQTAGIDEPATDKVEWVGSHGFVSFATRCYIGTVFI